MGMESRMLLTPLLEVVEAAAAAVAARRSRLHRALAQAAHHVDGLLVARLRG